MERELKKDAAGETEKKVTKTEFARRATRQKALEWIGSTGERHCVHHCFRDFKMFQRSTANCVGFDH